MPVVGILYLMISFRAKCLRFLRGKAVLGCLALSLLCASQVSGSVVAVDLGGDMVTRTRDFRLGQQYENPEGVFSRIRIGSFPLSPEPALYSGPTFYGIIQQTGDPSGYTWSTRVVDGIDGDFLQVRTIFPEEVSLNTIYLFKKEDFGSGAAAVQQLSLAALDSLSASISMLAGSGDNAVQSARFLVQSGNQWYISEVAISESGALTIGDPATSRWARYSLPRQTGGKVQPAPANYEVAGSALTDIQAVGLWSHIFGSSAGNASAEIRLTEFRTVWIPEPGMTGVALAGLATVAVFGLLRRRR